jgi:hypothetical protein
MKASGLPSALATTRLTPHRRNRPCGAYQATDARRVSRTRIAFGTDRLRSQRPVLLLDPSLIVPEEKKTCSSILCTWRAAASRRTGAATDTTFTELIIISDETRAT